MNCTEKNTVLISGASYPSSDVFSITRQFALSARKFGYPIHFLHWRDSFKSWSDIKYKSVVDNERQLRDLGIEYLVWCDASDSVCVSPFSEFLEAAQTINLPKNSLLTCVDWFHPYSFGYANEDPVLRGAGISMVNKVPGYSCMGLIFGHIDAYISHYQVITAMHTAWRKNSKALAREYDLEQFSDLTDRAFKHNCDQILCHLRQVKEPASVIPDVGQRLFSNYLGTDPNVTVSEMRTFKDKERITSYIGDACILHGSPVFRTGKPLENFVNTLLYDPTA